MADIGETIPGTIRRRCALVSALAALAAAAMRPEPANAHADHGTPSTTALPSGAVRRAAQVNPIALRMASGEKADLRTRLQGEATGVQLFFTGCGATCVMQGALFAEVQGLLRSSRSPTRLLSLSIDPLGDDPKVLTGWLQKFGARDPCWTAAVPNVRDVGLMTSEFSGGSDPAALVPHLNRVFLFDRRGVLTWVTGVDPAASEVAALMARRSG